MRERDRWGVLVVTEGVGVCMGTLWRWAPAVLRLLLTEVDIGVCACEVMGDVMQAMNLEPRLIIELCIACCAVCGQ